MKFLKYFLIFVIFILNLGFLVSNSYSIGVYDLGTLTYYINNAQPQIKINVSSPFEKINLSKGILNISNNIIQIPYNKILDPNINPSLILKYPFTNPITENDNISYKLFAYGMDGLEIIPQGDPSNFKIKYDNTIPTLVSNLDPVYNLIGTNNLSISFGFSELINSYTILTNNANPIIFRTSGNRLNNFKQNFDISFFSNNLNEGNNNITINFYDLAGNSNTLSFIIYKIGIPMTIKIKNSPGNYFYDKNFPDFFNGTIYTKQSTFDLTIETSKPANCFYSTSLTNFTTFENVIPRTSFTSSANNNLEHTTSIPTSTPNGNLWVACKNIAIPSEIVYLSSQLNLGNSLIKTKKDINPINFKILSTFPSSDVTNNVLDIISNTNKKSVCTYQLDNNINIVQIPYANNSNSNHIQKNKTISDGKHLIKFSCFDVLGTTIIKSVNFNLNSSLGVQINVKNPYYIGSANSKINFTLSESSNCKFSKLSNQESNFANLTSVTLNGVKGSFKGDYVKGNNEFYIYCQKSVNIIHKKFNVIFDDSAPIISNLIFLNNGVESSFLSSSRKLSFKFNVSTKIPIKNYFVKLIADNSSIDKQITTNHASLFGENFSAIKSIEIIAENILGKKSTKLSKRLKFDLDKPILKTLFMGNKLKITCFDSLSGCSRISYGLSKTNSNCRINTNYNLNSSISFKNQNFICINGFDKAGNLAILNKALIFNFQNPNSNLSQNPNSTNIPKLNTSNTFQNQSNSLNKSNSTQQNIPQDNPIFKNNFPNNSNGSSNNYVLIAAIFILIASVSGGSYYMYSKGYLNNQLKRFGIKPTNVKDGNGQYYNNISNSKSNISNNLQKSNTSKIPKSNYDEHLNKLNDFIDEKYEKGNKVFSKFDEKPQKGKVKGYKDTLMEIKKNKLSKEDFDDFYKSSLNEENLKVSNLENDSIAFEKFYEKKKKNDKKTKNKKSSSKSKKK